MDTGSREENVKTESRASVSDSIRAEPRAIHGRLGRQQKDRTADTNRMLESDVHDRHGRWDILFTHNASRAPTLSSGLNQENHSQSPLLHTKFLTFPNPGQPPCHPKPLNVLSCPFYVVAATYRAND